jgi:hypothetical protein
MPPPNAPTDPPPPPAPKRRRGGSTPGSRRGHTPRKSNTGVRGVSEVIRAGHPPAFRVQWLDSTGQRHSRSFRFTPADRHVILGQAAAHFAAHHVPAHRIG